MTSYYASIFEINLNFVSLSLFQARTTSHLRLDFCFRYIMKEIFNVEQNFFEKDLKLCFIVKIYKRNNSKINTRIV